MDFKKNLSELHQKKDANEFSHKVKKLFYERLRIIGKVGFIRQIEGDEGIVKLQSRLKKHLVDIEELLNEGI